MQKVKSFLNKQINYQLIFKILLITFIIYLIIVLFSFSPYDASWSQTNLNIPIHNLGGTTGAWIADILFVTFGKLSYALPIIILFFFI